MFEHDTSCGVGACLELANGDSSVGAADVLADTSSAQAFMGRRFAGGSPALGEADMRQLRILRHGLLDVLSRRDTEQAAAVLNQLAADAGATPLMARHGEDDWHIDWYAPGAPPGKRATTQMTTALMGFLVTRGFEGIRVCNGPHCANYFADFTKNRSKKFCDSGGCAARAHTAAYRARQRSKAE